MKSKLPTIISLFAVFSVSLPVIPFVAQPVSAQSVDTLADRFCSNTKLPDGQENSAVRYPDECKVGYRAGYRGQSLQKCQDVAPIFNKPQENSACRLAFKYGKEAAKKENPDNRDGNSEKQKKAADNACRDKGYKDQELEACKKGYLNRVEGDPKSSCNQSGRQGAACVAGWEMADKKADERASDDDSQGGPDNKDGPREVECEDGGDLGWIVCPVINMGINFTDTIYRDFVEPLLQDVPISSDPKDGSYKAWQQFRLIANILLVGTLLAVVYSQARGGGK